MSSKLPDELTKGRFQLRPFEFDDIERPVKTARASTIRRREVRRGIEDKLEQRRLAKELESF